MRMAAGLYAAQSPEKLVDILFKHGSWLAGQMRTAGLPALDPAAMAEIRSHEALRNVSPVFEQISKREAIADRCRPISDCGRMIARQIGKCRGDFCVFDLISIVRRMTLVLRYWFHSRVYPYLW